MSQKKTPLWKRIDWDQIEYTVFIGFMFLLGAVLMGIIEGGRELAFRMYLLMIVFAGIFIISIHFKNRMKREQKEIAIYGYVNRREKIDTIFWILGGLFDFALLIASMITALHLIAEASFGEVDLVKLTLLIILLGIIRDRFKRMLRL